MRNSSLEEKSLTHQGGDFLSLYDVQEQFYVIKKRLQKHNVDQNNRQELERILEQLLDFELGRFLIKNSGAFSGYWTNYIILGFKKSPISNPLENFIVNKAPLVLATQKRFKIFQHLLKKNIKSNSVVCSIPCGLMQDLQTLELADEITELRLVGIDLDKTALDLAKELALNQKVKYQCDFFQRDAWNLQEFKGQFDIVTSNGLNIYENNDERVLELYKNFYEILRPGGRFIGSGLTYPPNKAKPTEWDMTKINPEDLTLQKLIFLDVLEATWSHFRSSAESIAQLEEAGFTDIEIHWDAAKMFYSFEAKKSMPHI